LGEGELVVRGSHRRSCLSKVCADGSAGVDVLVVFVGVVGLSTASDFDSDVALVEASRGTQLVQDEIIAVLGFNVVGGGQSGGRSGRFQVAKVLVLRSLPIAIWVEVCFDTLSAFVAMRVYALVSPGRFVLIIRYSIGCLRGVAVEPVHAIDVVDGDGAEKLDRDGVGVDGKFMA
jgi:hypothetical protein